MSSLQDIRTGETAADTKLNQFREQVQASAATVVVGMEKVVDEILCAVIAGGHVLLEGVPGTAKTTLAKVLARIFGLGYNRVQFTPDLLPSDITGTQILDRQKNDFVLRPGPLFCQLLLADEVNRAPAKTQSALLEAMQEHQVTIEGTTLKLPRPFIVLATQNPVEQEGVYRLPEAQLDRFLIRVELGYPQRDIEVDMLTLHGKSSSSKDSAGKSENGQSSVPASWPLPQATPELILELQERVTEVHAAPGVLQYIVDLARASRSHPDLLLGASPRASLNLLQCSKARARLRGRAYITHEDVQSLVESVWGHRLILLPEVEVEGRRVKDVIADLVLKQKVT